ncbi:LOW QUALITY PROTEIN: protein AAR2 homolog [Acropora millepora]|uniref:LOW QUALITY PROTEIN: protein AAR2 homolog n=1 Tax=Acropora millepora TaxID=45264 RepID=UPI001CF2E6DF|nr:LOW QUALITY PROTEIN: protein AAR2 homolog [Acropora millepora]
MSRLGSHCGGLTEMDPEVAKRLHAEGAVLIVLDVPEGTELGIDYFSWNVGPRFKGVKMIPHGLHFVYYSAVSKAGQTAPRTGMFFFSKRQDIFVMKWDAVSEDVVEIGIDEEEKEKYREGLQEMDRFLGPYPYENFKKWVSLTNHITKDLLERVQPKCKKISSVTELPIDPQYPGVSGSASENAVLSVGLNPDAVFQFTKFPKHRYPEGASPMEISKHSMDSSYALSCMLDGMKDRKEILGELQFAFVCFLVGQVFDAFEHWKKLLHLLCSCDEAVETNVDLFDALIGLLHFQVLEIPKDFFVDIVSTNNFLTTTLQVFFSNLKSSATVDKKLVEKARRFQRHLTKRFNWDFETEPDEFAPVVVET